jgi:hypothetical protein
MKNEIPAIGIIGGSERLIPGPNDRREIEP